MRAPDWTLRRLSDWSYVVEHLGEETSFRGLGRGSSDHQEHGGALQTGARELYFA